MVPDAVYSNGLAITSRALLAGQDHAACIKPIYWYRIANLPDRKNGCKAGLKRRRQRLVLDQGRPSPVLDRPPRLAVRLFPRRPKLSYALPDSIGATAL